MLNEYFYPAGGPVIPALPRISNIIWKTRGMFQVLILGTLVTVSHTVVSLRREADGIASEGR